LAHGIETGLCFLSTMIVTGNSSKIKDGTHAKWRASSIKLTGNQSRLSLEKNQSTFRWKPVLAFSYYIFLASGKIELKPEVQEPKMNTCPKIDDCYQVTMVLDKDYAFDWQYASELKKVCHNCLAGVSNVMSSGFNEEKVVVSGVTPAPQYI
jgi:hypothetical protein